MTVGSIELEFAGAKYLCRAEFKNIAKIEQLLGKGIYQIGVEASNGTAKLSEFVIILQQMLLSAGANRSPDTIGAEVMKVGAGQFLSPCSKYCLMAFAGPDAFEDKDGADSTAPLKGTEDTIVLQ